MPRGLKDFATGHPLIQAKRLFGRLALQVDVNLCGRDELPEEQGNEFWA